MNSKLLVLILIVASLISMKVFSDDDEWEEHNVKGKYSENNERSRVSSPKIVNAKFKAECTSCHMAYPPGLLPTRSWDKIMNTLDKHFGEDASLDDKTKNEILDYLAKNSSDQAPSRRGTKILESIKKDDVVIRITDTSYFQRKHHELSDNVFKRKAIGSKANCIACHQGAEVGNFDEDSVRIPRANEELKKVKK